MNKPPIIPPSLPAQAAEPVAVRPRQFSLAEVLLVTTEIAFCLALIRWEFVSPITFVLVAKTYALLHLSRGRALRGVLQGDWAAVR